MSTELTAALSVRRKRKKSRLCSSKIH